MNLSESYKRKLKNLAGINEHSNMPIGVNTPEPNDSEIKFPVIFSILTAEAVQRQEEKGNGIPPSFSHNGYHFKVEDMETLKKLESKYTVGGMYNNENIIQVNTQPMNKNVYAFGRY